MTKKKMSIILICLAIVSFLFFAYKAKPKAIYYETNYLVITQLGKNLYSNKYNIDQLISKGLESGFVVGNTNDSILIAASKKDKDTGKKKYYLAQYILKNNNLIIDEIIELKNINFENDEEYAIIHRVINDYLYYFTGRSKELVKYNLLNHKKEILIRINDCDTLIDFDEKYLHYTVNKPLARVISRFDNKNIIDIARFEDNPQIKLIYGKDILVLLEDNNKLSYYNLKTKEKTFIRDLKTFSFESGLHPKNWSDKITQ